MQEKTSPHEAGHPTRFGCLNALLLFLIASRSQPFTFSFQVMPVLSGSPTCREM
jgi:hypothetical protein